jgi:hypothetical protein
MSSSRSYGGGGGARAQSQQLKQITQKEMKAFLENPDDPVNLEPFQPHLTRTSNVTMNNKMSGALLKVLDSQPDLIIKLLDFKPDQKKTTSKSRIISGARSLVSHLHPTDLKHTDLLKKLIDILVKTSHQKQALSLLELMNQNIGRTDELFADAIKDRKIIQKSLKLIDKAKKILKGEIAPDKETVNFLKKITQARMTPLKGSTPLLPDLSSTQQYKKHVERFIYQYDEPSQKRIIEAVMYLQNKEDTNLKRAPAQYLYRRLFDGVLDLQQRRNLHQLLTNIEELQERIQRDGDIKRKDIREFLSDPNYQLTGDLANDDLVNLQRKMSQPLHFVLTKEPVLIDVILDALKGKNNRSRRYEILQTMMHILIQDFNDDKIVQYLKKVVPYVFDKLKRDKVNAIENPVYKFLDHTLNLRNREELLETALTTQVLDEIRRKLHDIKNPPSQSQKEHSPRVNVQQFFKEKDLDPFDRLPFRQYLREKDLIIMPTTKKVLEEEWTKYNTSKRR